MEALFSIENLIALLTLSGLEIALGIDNLVFLAIVTGRLPEHQRSSARRIGLALAMFTRILLLLGLSWLVGLTTPWFTIADHGFSGKDLILLLGGLFLLTKSTYEIHHSVEEPGQEESTTGKAAASYGAALVQIMLIDMIFSLDSVITAIGMVNHVEIMIAAVVLSVSMMMVFANIISDFVTNHPSLKLLALAFLILIGALLIAEGWGAHVNKGYIYFAMAFSFGIELLNMRRRSKMQAKKATTAS